MKIGTGHSPCRDRALVSVGRGPRNTGRAQPPAQARRRGPARHKAGDGRLGGARSRPPVGHQALQEMGGGGLAPRPPVACSRDPAVAGRHRQA